MSRQILFNNATAVPAAAGGVNDPFEIAEARVAAFNPEDYGSGTLDLTAPYDGKYVEFAQGAAEGDTPVRTSLINVDDVVEVFSRPYVAPIAQVTTVVPETGTGEATVRVVEVSAGFKPHKRVTITVKLDGKTKAQITDDFVAQFNANSPKFITASNGASDNLVLTGNIGVSFETSTDMEAAAWTITSTAAPNFGSGTAEHAKILEEQAWGQHANYTNRINLPIPPVSYAANSTYDLFIIRVKTNTTRNVGGLAQKHQDIYIAVQATATGIDLEEFFFGEEAED